MDQCWEYEPRRRPAAAEVVKELQNLLDSMVSLVARLCGHIEPHHHQGIVIFFYLLPPGSAYARQSPYHHNHQEGLPAGFGARCARRQVSWAFLCLGRASIVKSMYPKGLRV